MELLDHKFTPITDYTVTYNPTDTTKGTITPTVTPKSGGKLTGAAVAGDAFTITQSDTTFTGGIKTYKDATAQSAFTYGDTITVKVTPTVTGTAPIVKGRAAPTANQMALYQGDVQLTEPQAVTSGRELSFAINTADKLLATGENTITAKYVASADMAAHEESVTITLNKKQLTGGTIGGNAYTYTGTDVIKNVAVAFDARHGIVGNDMVSAEVTGTIWYQNVGDNKPFTVSSITGFKGKDANYYLAPTDLSTITGTVNIKPATIAALGVAAKNKTTPDYSGSYEAIGDHNDTIIVTVTIFGVNGESPSGTVVFKNDDNVLATEATVGGVASYEWENPPAGEIHIAANFTASDSNYTTEVVTEPYDFIIDKIAQEELFITPVTGKVYGDGFTLETTGGSGEGEVSYSTADEDVLTINSDQARCKGAGTTTITATKAGDDNHNATTATYEITVGKATPTISWGDTSQSVDYTGSPAAITPPIVTLVNSETYSGAISYQYKSTAARLTNPFGLLEGYTEGLPVNVGEYQIVATVAEDGNYKEADSTPMTLTIQKSTPELTVETDYSGKDYDGTPIALPTDEQMTIIGAEYDKVTFAYSRAADMSIPSSTAPTDAGTYYVQASVEEGDNNKAASSAAKPFTIAKINPVIMVSTSKSAELGGKEITVTVQITNPEGASTGFPTAGEIAITPTNATLNGSITGANGTYTATYTLAAYSEGAQASFTATVPTATTNYNANTTGTISSDVEILDKYTPTVALTADNNSVRYGESVTLTATVGKAGKTSPLAGTVQFKKDGNALGEAVTIDADGKAIFTLGKDILQADPYQFTAEFIPAVGSDYKGVTSASLVVRVDQAAMSGNLTLTGTPQFGETLTADTSALKGLEGDSLGGFTYQWTRSGDGDITDATNSAYTVTEADIGKSLFVTVTPMNPNYHKRLSDFVIPAKADSTVTITSNLIKTYDGTAAANPTVETTGSDGAVTFEWYDSGEVQLDSAPTNTGKYSVVAQLAETNTHNAATSTRETFIIQPKTITPTITVAEVTYDGTAKEPALTVKDGSTVLTSGTDYTAVYSDNVNAGVGTGKVKVTLNGNYSGNAEQTFTINKIAYAGTAITGGKDVIQNTEASDVQFDLASLSFPAGFQNKEFLSVAIGTNTDGLLTGTPSISGTKVVFDVAAIEKDKTGVLNVTVKSTNYNDYTVAITVTTVAKTPVAITGLTAETNLSYSGSPQKGYTGTAAFSPTWSGTLDYTYYEGTGTGGTKLSGAPTNAGTYTVVASIPDSDTSYEGSHADITFAIGQKEITVTAGTYTVSKSYDGTTAAGIGTGTLEASGILPADSGVSVVPGIIPAYSGSEAKSDYEIDLPISINGDTNSNYTLAANTVTVPGEITKATVTATIDAIAAEDYTGSQIKPTVTVKVNGNTIADTNYTVEYGANINAGTDAGSVTVKAATGWNYTFDAVTATFTTNKIAYAGTAITGGKDVIQNTEASDVQFDLASLSFPAGFQDKEFVSVAIGTNTDGLLTGTPSISGTKVKFDVSSKAVGKTGVLDVTVKSTNYNDYTVAITVTTVAKTPVAITGLTAETNLSYSSSPQKGYSGTVSVEGNKVPTNELVYAYTSTDGGGYNSATPPTNAGDYKLVVSIADSNASYIGSHADILFTIGKQAVTVNADNQTMVKGGTLPTFTVRYTGFVGAENEGNAALATAAVANCTADGTTVGTFEISLTTQAILNATIGKNYNITEQKGGTLTVSEKTYGITASAGTGGTISPSGTVTVTDGASQTFTITANSSYSIADVTVDGTSQGAISTYTFSNVTGNHTISATFGDNGDDGGSTGGGGGSTGGGGNSGGGSNTPAPPTTNDPTLPENGNVNINPTMDKDGNATVSVGDKDIEKAIQEAEKQAKKNGTEKNGIAVTITIDTNKTLNSFTANLPKSTQEKLIARKASTLTIDGGATITFDLDAIKQMNSTANADVVVTATKTASSTLSKDAQAATGGRPVYDFKVTGDGKNMIAFGNGKLSLSIPYELQKVDGNGKPSPAGSFETPGNLVGVYIDGAGKPTYLPDSTYDTASKTMRIHTNHLSMYGVAYQTNPATTPTFTDIAGHWAKDEIAFVVEKGLFSGTTETTFSPDLSMTRGMFVTVLGRLAGIDGSKYQTSSFDDVAAGSYYLPYIEWASKNAITNGVGDGKFAPDQAVARQEMAVFMSNYAKASGYTLPITQQELSFSDQADINAWATSAVKELQMAGILMGRDGGEFDPTGTATRAEVSAMLRRFVELMENSETAEG